MNCTYCKREMHNRRLSFDGLLKTRDHYIPLSRGGKNDKANIRMACYRCNSIKGNMMPDLWERFMQDNPMWWTKQINVAKPGALKPTVLPASHSKYILTYGKKAYRSWVARGCPTPPYDMRRLRPDEPIPIEFEDPAQQAAFEAYAKKYRHILRVPIWVSKERTT